MARRTGESDEVLGIDPDEAEGDGCEAHSDNED